MLSSDFDYSADLFRTITSPLSDDDISVFGLTKCEF